MRFGDCLAELTKERGWARSELVHALRREGVNSSLVYRWLRNERTPKLYSGDRERIAACLRLSQGDYERLRQAQVESLEGRENPSKASAIQEIQPPSASTGYRQGPQPNSDPTHNGQLHAKRLVPGAIRGQDAVLETAIALIEAAPAPPSPSRRGILLTHMGRGVIDPFGDHLNWWLSTLRNTLQNGYDVSHLVTIEGTAAWSRHMVQHLLRLTGSVGSYQPRYFLQYGSLQHPFEMLIVPEVGAMIALSTGHDRQVDSALLLRDPQEVELLRAHFGALANDTRPLTNVFSTPEDKHRFVDTLLQVEEREGETFLAAGGPCLHTAPYSWFQEGSTWARNLRAWGVTDPPWMIGVQKRRVDAFL
ncbi:MAG TPA: hypothetical protein VHS28_03445, partial [Chloroflexota bacterium]|nr:hypothetical protein [Chloroflexota bacterium]